MSGLYTNFVTEYNLGNINLVTDDLSWVPVSNAYEFDASHVNTSSISGLTVGSSQPLGGTKTVNADSVFRSTEGKVTFPITSLTSVLNGVILFKEGTNELISYHTPLRSVTLGLTIQVDFIYNTGGFFQISPEEVFNTKLVSYRAIEVAYPRVSTMRS